MLLISAVPDSVETLARNATVVCCLWDWPAPATKSLAVVVLGNAGGWSLGGQALACPSCHADDLGFDFAVVWSLA